MTPPESRLHILGNGLTPRQKKNMGQLNVTLDEMNEAFSSERIENENMVKWYMQQIPGLVAKMLGDALAVNGLTMAPPTDMPGTPPNTQDGEAPNVQGDSTEPAA